MRYRSNVLKINLRQVNKYVIFFEAACGIVVAWGTMLHTARSRVRFPMRSLNFSVDLNQFM
jgi:hypothetical protein